MHAQFAERAIHEALLCCLCPDTTAVAPCQVTPSQVQSQLAPSCLRAITRIWLSATAVTGDAGTTSEA